MFVKVLSLLAITTASSYNCDDCLRVAIQLLERPESSLLPALMIFEELSAAYKLAEYDGCIPNTASLMVAAARFLQGRWASRYVEFFAFREDLIAYQSRRLTYDRPPSPSASDTLDPPSIPQRADGADVLELLAAVNQRDPLRELGMARGRAQTRSLRPVSPIVDLAGSPVSRLPDLPRLTSRLPHASESLPDSTDLGPPRLTRDFGCLDFD